MRAASAAFLALAAILGAPRQPAAQPSMFEAIPGEFTWKVVASVENLHFVLFPNQKKNIVLAWGGIGAGDAVRFAAALTAAKPVDEVQLYSPGGSLYEGIKIGILIRNRGLSTRVPDGMRCVSACNFAFMGGVVRNVDPSGSFEVHMFSGGPEQLFADADKPPTTIEQYNKRHQIKLDPDAVQAFVDDKKKKDPNFTLEELLRSQALEADVKDLQEDSAQTAADIAQFLVTMRLSLDFLTAFASIPNDEPRPLTRKELKEFNVVNN
jgi:hypothetical protein